MKKKSVASGSGREARPSRASARLLKTSTDLGVDGLLQKVKEKTRKTGREEERLKTKGCKLEKKRGSLVVREVRPSKNK